MHKGQVPTVTILASMFTQIKAFLNQPYPDRDDFKSIALNALATGLLIFFILYVFRPFDINNYHEVFLAALAFGVITGGVTILYELALVHVFKISREEPSWTFLKWMWIMLRGTLLIGVFPVVIFGSFKMISKLKQNRDILCIEAQQNYVVIIYESEAGIKSEMIRNTLSNIAASLAGTSIIRCHRSYLVNQNRIAQITGNAQGLKLQVSGLTDKIVPVSRKYIPVFKG